MKTDCSIWNCKCVFWYWLVQHHTILLGWIAWNYFHMGIYYTLLNGTFQKEIQCISTHVSN